MLEPASSAPLQDRRFLLLELLGRGGMGSVYRAFDRAEQRLVALKVPCTRARSGPAHPLSEEFDVWSRLDHPHIVRAYELGVAASGPIGRDTPYLVLEHVAGEPAHRALRCGRVPGPAVEAVAGQILSALAHVHAHGFLHRDLKPANVLVEPVTPEPFVKLTDFGLAARMGRPGEPGIVSGSLAYVSPEALLGLPLDARTDLYGLGILLFRLATGELPAPDTSPRAVLRWHLAGPPIEPERIRPRLSSRLCRFMRRLTARDPSLRPGSAVQASRLLGRECPPGRIGRSAGGGAWLARLRLALDATRLGASRKLVIAGTPSAARELLREATVWTQVRGLRLLKVSGDVAATPTRLGQLVLGWLAEAGDATSDGIRRRRFDGWLPLALVGDLPLVSRAGAERLTGPAPREEEAGRAVGELVFDLAMRRPTVLWVEDGAPSARFVRELVRHLTRKIAGAREAIPGRGGLLLVEQRPSDAPATPFGYPASGRFRVGAIRPRGSPATRPPTGAWPGFPR